MCHYLNAAATVRATPLGEQIIAQAQTVLEQTNIINEMANLGKDPLGVRLALFLPLAFICFRTLFRSYKKLPPTCLYISKKTTPLLRENCVRVNWMPLLSHCPLMNLMAVTQSLYEESFVVLLAKDHPLAERKTITAKQLEKEQVLLLGEGHCFRDQVLEACPGLRKTLPAAMTRCNLCGR